MHRRLAKPRIVPVLALACAMGSCMENSVGAPAQGPSPAAVSATLALDLRNPQAASEFIHGDVVLFPVPRTGLALAVDGGASPGAQDGYVDQVFVLQQQQPAAMDVRALSNAEVHYAGRMLSVRAAGRAPVLLLVQGEGDAAPDLSGGRTAGAERFAGFGISRRTGAWEVRLQEVTGTAMADLLPTCATPRADGVTAAANCDSGGMGSTSCSTTCLTVNGGSCSTSCGAGYYACCNKGACTCTCEPAGGPQPPPINITSQPPGSARP
jgi:hypothetical protein